MAKNESIGGRSYNEPAKNIGRIDTKAAQRLEDARARHTMTMRLSDHMASCKVCTTEGPSDCAQAVVMADAFRNRFNSAQQGDK